MKNKLPRRPFYFGLLFLMILQTAQAQQGTRWKPKTVGRDQIATKIPYSPLGITRSISEVSEFANAATIDLTPEEKLKKQISRQGAAKAFRVKNSLIVPPPGKNSSMQKSKILSRLTRTRR